MAPTNGSQAAEQDRGEARPRAEREGPPPPEPADEPRVLDEICVEELAIDGICGVY